ncbi:hypothetical protein SUDANB145_07271 (plasmid) [Streptomyces sp. enrichment culture]
MTTRVTCPGCGKRVALTPTRRLWTHGRPPCPRSRRRLTVAWGTHYRGRRVITVPGPDTWNPTRLEGAA